MTSWTEKEIRSIGRVVTGKTPPKEIEDYWIGDELFVSPKDMEFDSLYIDKTQATISTKALDKFKNQNIPQNSVMYTALSYGFGKIGLAKQRLLTNQQINSVIVNNSYNYKFVYYLLRISTPHIYSYNSGIDTPIVPKSVFEKIKLNVTSLPIQKKIAAILSSYDDFIENNNRRIAILKKMAEELYREWFVRLRFPGHLKAKIVKGVPDGWKEKRVEDLIIRVSVGKRYDDKTVFPDGQIPVLDQGQSGIIGFHNDAPDVIASIENPIIVFANHTCYQRLIFYSFSAIQNVLPFKPNNELPSNIFWLHYATKDLIEFSEYKGHWPEFSKKLLYYPGEALTEQFGLKVKPLLLQITQLDKINRNLIASRDRLLSRLMSGKIDVENMDIEFPASMKEELVHA